jgi:hypothetical protein
VNKTRLRLAAGVSAAVVVAATGSAYAGTSSGTTVSLGVTGAGTRQLDVLDLSGAQLTNLALNPNVPAPFRVRVSDNGIGSLTSASSGFTVSAVMNNLYLKNGNSYDYTSKIPSSDVSISYPTSPLSAFGVSFDDLAKVLVSGTIPTCTTLQGLNILSLTDVLGVASSLCTLTGTTGLPVSGLAVNSVIQKTVTPTVNNLLDLPFQLSGNEAGAFTNPDFANGLGVNDPAKTQTTGTARQVMTGVPGLTNALQTEITSALGTLPTQLTSATGAGALTSVSTLMSALSSSTSSTLQSLGSALSSLTQSQQVSILNNLVGSLVNPALGDISNEIGTYNAFPMLKATPTGSVTPGTYAGTMTVTLVQP